MLHRLFLLLVSLSLTPLLARAVEHEPPHKIKVVVASPLSDPDVTTYYVGFLTKGRRAGEGTREDREKIQSAQTAYINRLAREGKLLATGPIVDHSEWRGLYIFKCASLADAQALAAEDPEVKTGRLVIEIHPWMTERGSVRDPQFPSHR